MEFVIPGCKPEPSLRVNSRMVHLTYAALYDGELTFASSLVAAKGWAAARQGLREYTIANELHSAPADPQRAHHFHFYIKFGKKVDIRDRLHTTIFDLRGQNGRTLHPEIQSVLNTPADRERVINYDMKDGKYIAELETPLVNDARRDRAEAEAAADDDEDGGEGERAEEKETVRTRSPACPPAACPPACVRTHTCVLDSRSRCQTASSTGTRRARCRRATTTRSLKRTSR
tara:strand:- start:41 stop:733 length:693 start_codon:yes stop_codon:yes gene_type:complete